MPKDQPPCVYIFSHVYLPLHQQNSAKYLNMVSNYIFFKLTKIFDENLNFSHMMKTI